MDLILSTFQNTFLLIDMVVVRSVRAPGAGWIFDLTHSFLLTLSRPKLTPEGVSVTFVVRTATQKSYQLVGVRK